MRHRKNFNHLGRKTGHRKAMLANMASSLILHKRIQTTIAKAKALRIYVEPLITKSKEDSTHSRRVVFSQLQDKEAVTELFREVSPKIAERPGGYTRILKTGTRLGDNADMCVIELVDYNENLLTAKEEAASKSGRRKRRGGKKKATEATNQVKEAQVVEGTETKSKATEAVADTNVEQEPVKAETETTTTKVEETKADSEEKIEAVEKEEEVKAEEKVEASDEASKPEAEYKAETVEEDKKAETDQKAEAAKPEEEVKAKAEEKGDDKEEEKKKEE